jgi:hypothetical protein
MAAPLGAKPAPATNRTTTVKDNQSPEQIAADKAARAERERENRRIQRISIRHRLRIAKANSAEAKAAYDAVKAEETEIYRLGKAAGYMRAELDEDLVDMNMDPREYRKKEAVRAERKSDFVDIGEQASLIDDKAASEEVRDEAYWTAMGYRAGMNWEACEPKEVPARFTTNWTDGWHMGRKKLQDALAAADAAATEDDDEGGDAAPEPDADKESTSALDAIAEVEPEIVAQVKEDHGDGFEMSEEERQAQLHRPKPVDPEAV